MKPEKRDKMRSALYLLVAAYESGSHTTFHAVVGDPEFEKKVIQPLKEIYGWEPKDDLVVKEMKEKSKGLSTSAVRMLFKIAAAAAATAVTVGGVYYLTKERKKE